MSELCKVIELIMEIMSDASCNFYSLEFTKMSVLLVQFTLAEEI